MECYCGKLLVKDQKKFCSKSCSAKFNNSRRAPRTDQSKLKTALSVCESLGIDYHVKPPKVLRKRIEHSLKFKRMRNIWYQMMHRCHTPHHNDYKYYGAKGIEVSSSWREFKAFYDDMHGTWFEGATIDRLDNSKGYFKENCQWLTHYENATKRYTSLV